MNIKKVKRLMVSLICVLTFSIMLFPNHYASDTYNIIELGFKEYAIKWFAPSGRIIGMLVLFIFEKIGCSCDLYIFIMKLIAILIATISINIFYELLLKHSNQEINVLKKIVYFLSTIILFLNSATYEYFYYPESGVMWLGVLLVILAIKANLRLEDKFRYIKSFVLVFLAMNCYQAIILIYLPMLILFLGLKYDSFKKVFCEILKSGIILCLNLILGYLIIEILRNKFDVIIYRYNNIIINKDIMKYNLYELLLLYNGGIPNLAITVINLMTVEFIVTIPKETLKYSRKNIIVMALLIIVISFVQVFTLISITDFYIADRIQYAYIATIGLNLLFMAFYTKILDIKIINKGFAIICMLIAIFNIFNSINITIDSRLVRQRDIAIATRISKLIAEYENSNQEIKYVEYCYDFYNTKFDKDVRKVGEATQRVMWGDWVIDNAIRYFSGKKELIINKNQDIYKNIFNEKNWDEFSEEQVKFINDTMYFCIY